MSKKTHCKRYSDDDGMEIRIPEYNLPEPYSTELYALIQKIDADIGLKNGGTALYWHLMPIFDMHTKGE